MNQTQIMKAIQSSTDVKISKYIVLHAEEYQEDVYETLEDALEVIEESVDKDDEDYLMVCGLIPLADAITISTRDYDLLI